MTRARLALVLAGALVLFGAWLLANSGQRTLYPSGGGGGGYVSDMTPVDVSLWEYANPNTHEITGRSITLTIPKAYLINSSNWHGGPQIFISILFDLNNEKPWLVGGAGTTLDRRKLSSLPERQLVLFLDYNRGQPVEYSPRAVKFSDDQTTIGIGRNPAVPVPGEYCGFDLFDSGEPWGGGRDASGERIPDSRSIQLSPFDHARVFARKNSSGTYDRIVRCNPASSPGYYPWCTTGADFEGWGLRIWFSGQHLCRVDELVNQTRTFLGRYVSGRTPPD